MVAKIDEELGSIGDDKRREYQLIVLPVVSRTNVYDVEVPTALY